MNSVLIPLRKLSWRAPSSDERIWNGCVDFIRNLAAERQALMDRFAMDSALILFNRSALPTEPELKASNLEAKTNS